jgi:hypothetical protein
MAIGTFREDQLVLEIFNNISSDPIISAKNISSKKSNKSISYSSSSPDSLENPSIHSNLSNDSLELQPSEAKSQGTIVRLLKNFNDSTISDFCYSSDFNYLFIVSQNELKGYCAKKLGVLSSYKRLIGAKSLKMKIQRNLVSLGGDCLL